MVEGPSFFDKVHRLEVHGYPPQDDDTADDFLWSVTARMGRNDSIILWGYLRQSAEDGFGQVQVVGFPRRSKWSAVSKSAQDIELFLDWCAEVATEVMYDTARRALQTQAAAMDFQFELDLNAPDVRVKFSPPSDEQLAAIRALDDDSEREDSPGKD